GSRPHKLVSGCQKKRAQRSTGSPPDTSGWTPLTSGEQQSAWRKETLPGRWLSSETFRTSRRRLASRRTHSSKHVCSLASRTWLWAIGTPPLPQPRPPSLLLNQIG